MPTNHLANTNNGNAVKKVATSTTTLQGRTSTLAIYNVAWSELKKVVGGDLEAVVKSMKRDDEEDLAQGYRQPTNHEDRLGNLPVAPGNGVAYREYYVASNKLPKPGYVRLVSDLQNRRLFITPTHYDVWIPDRVAAEQLDEGALVAATHASAQSPFFLIITGA